MDSYGSLATAICLGIDNFQVARTVVGAAAPLTRILYASDWEGPTQIFSVDPTGRRPLGQVTVDHAPARIDVPYACGFTAPCSTS